MARIDSFEFLERELSRNLHSLNDCLAIYGALHLVRNLMKICWILKSVYRLTKRSADIKSFGSHAVISSIERPLGREIALNLAEKQISLIILVADEADEECKQFLKLLASKGVEIITLNQQQLNQCWNQLGDKNAGDKRKGEGASKPANDSKEQKREEQKTENGDVKKNEESQAADSSTEDTEIWRRIMAKDIGILINCSDYQPDRLRPFLSYGDREMDKLIETNIVQPMKLQRLFFKKLIGRERAMVLEVSSLAAIRPLPYLSLYSASKCFTNQLQRSLACEQRRHVLFKTWILTRTASRLFNDPSSGSSGKSPDNERPSEKSSEQPSERPLEQSSGQPSEKTSEKSSEKSSEKPSEKSSEKPSEKTSGKRSERPPGEMSTGQTKSFTRLFANVLLPNKQKLITRMLQYDYSTETTGYWLFALEYYLADCLPQMAVNLLLEYLVE